MGSGHQLWFVAVVIGVGIASAMYVTVICAASEYIAPVERVTVRDRLPGLLMQIVGAALSAAIIIPAQWTWQHVGLAPLFIPLWSWLSPLGTVGYILQVSVLLLVTDFLRYWRHRAEHRWFWPVHAVHHAPEKLHAANSLGHPLQMIPEILFVAVPLSLIEFDGPATPAFAAFITSFLAAYIHSPTGIHFGRLRAFVVDNRFHRIHHSVEQKHFDKNFGICFSLWDAMFGTAWWPAPGEWPEVGVDGVKAPATVRDFLLLPLAIVRASPMDAARTQDAGVESSTTESREASSALTGTTPRPAARQERGKSHADPEWAQGACASEA